MRFFVPTLAATALTFVGVGAEAAPVKPKAPAARSVQPASTARLTGITVVPRAVTLDGPRAEQGLIVTGSYTDGTIRDLTEKAQFQVSAPRIAALRKDVSRRTVRPVGDGPATVTVHVPGAAPASVSVQVRNIGVRVPVSFRNEVIPALTKAGCSTGTCHGTPTGKGGFRLSLQGYHPEMDFQTLAREGGGRRVNPADPGASLILTKPMMRVPHRGGKRLSPDMPEFAVLTRWIAEGAKDDAPGTPTLVKVEILPGRRSLKLPASKQQIAAMAHFSDGSVRDVTHLAKLTTSDDEIATVTREGQVEASKRGDLAVLVRYQDALESLRLTFLKDVPGFVWNKPPEQNYIDKHVFDRLKLFQIPASELSTDTEFLRRAYLDTIGKLPTGQEVKAFQNDPAPNKRAKLIDELVARPEFADFWALKWADVLHVKDETLKERGARAYHAWLRESIATNKPMDQFAREILTASGPTFTNAPANYFRAVDEPQVLSEMTAQVFMGVRMGCAKCHNHPFERWTQDEYYQFAAFFSQVQRKSGTVKEEETVSLNPHGEVTHLRTGQVMRPKLLGAEFAQVEKGADRRPALANWLTTKENPFFAKAMANRVWANLLGRGIVEPIDDFRDSNPPLNEALLDAMSKDFAEHNFDLKYLVRTIMNSRTYQLTSRTLPLNADDSLYFSHAVTRMLQAEVLADAVSQITGVPDEFPGYPAETRAVQLAGTKARTPFLKTFGRPDRNLPCECEREKDPNLFQALALISGRDVHGKLKHESGRIAQLARSQPNDSAVVDELYLSALSRQPSAKEKREWLSYLGKAPDRQQALEDLGWVLMNSKEFLFRH